MPGPVRREDRHEVSSLKRAKSFGSNRYEKKGRYSTAEWAEALQGPDQITSVHTRKWKVVIHTFGGERLGNVARDLRDPMSPPGKRPQSYSVPEPTRWVPYGHPALTWLAQDCPGVRGRSSQGGLYRMSEEELRSRMGATETGGAAVPMNLDIFLNWYEGPYM